MHAIIKKLTLLTLALCIGVVLSAGVFAKTDGETEAANESQLLRVTLPANAQRVLPQSVPAEITQTLDKITSAGKGKFRKGDSEVLLWGGANYSKANAATIINKLTGNLKTAGWQFSIEG